MKDSVIVITGASAGIGAALAHQVSSRGAKVVLVARRDTHLHQVASACGPAVLSVVADVTKRDEVKRVVEAAIGRFGHIDVWVNNVGRGISKLPSALTDADIDAMVAVNVKSALYGMQEVTPHFKARGKGHIINVSSMLGRVPVALMRSAYSASKHFLNSLTANFRMELHDTHPDIQVSLVSPGVVATDFGLNALHGGVDSRQLPGAQTADEVAQVIIQVIERRPADAYTRPGLRKQVIDYYAAEDLDAVERQPPFSLR